MLYVIKKDGTLEEFDGEKIVNAVNKSASRVMITLDDTAFHEIVGAVLEVIEEKGLTDIPVAVMHNIVEQVLDKYDPRIATSYRNYRNYKQDFVHVLDRVFQKSQVVRFQGDKENANTDSALVATKRCLIFNELNKRLYRKFFMTQEELQACRDGYIYIHDQSARLDTMNCCLFRVNEVMKGGFEMGNIWYNEPKTLDVFFDVLGDIILATASQQYGGFTVPEVDKLAAPYAEKSYKKYVDEYMEIRNQQTFTQEVHEWAMQKVERDFEQGFQGIEMKLNTVGSSRGDYPFITMTFGLATGDEYDICNTSKDNCDVTVLTVTAHLLVNQSGYQCDKPLDHQCDRNVYKISTDQVRQCRTDTTGKHTIYRTKDDTCEDYDCITRMDISAGSRCRNTDGHCSNTG